MPQNNKAELVRRLRRIEGQTRGVQRMLEEDRNCEDILHQLNAINEAVRSVSVMVCEKYALECMSTPRRRSGSRQAIAAMINAFTRVPR